ncbi:DUF4276 family protein [Klebsiella pasteurii]|uniref:DUF4276 family protein n=1 Tax=Klebsiella pasteurii TaxID=2587529 RepID=UPI0028779E85|nr:DUF4276 family protein [Klebsiella pasteurii]WND09579.1 DUF4276 family protein [Klebsiella pasteurii]
MMRVCVVCEGQTEVEFIRSCVAPALNDGRFLIYPAIIQAPSGAHRGGRVTVERLVAFMNRQYHETDRITTFVDFYGFQNADGRSASQLEEAIMAGLQAKQLESRFILPYVQLHEFEALLFSDVDKFEYVFDGWNDDVRQTLTRVRNQFNTPEDINNHPTTAPSKRILSAFAQGIYSKVIHGPLIAEAIGLATIRQQCPGFNLWCEKLEAWKAESRG